MRRWLHVGGGREANTAVAADQRARQGHGAGGEPLDRPGCEYWVEVTRRNYASRGYGMLALVERSSGTVVGFCGLVHPAGQAEPEIKCALRRDCWGKGFATEAATGLLGYARQLGLSDVIASTDPRNEASHRVLPTLPGLHPVCRSGSGDAAAGLPPVRAARILSLRKGPGS
ncbi:GNAT family N-acetyltransferase [Arenimonas fontis]